MSTTHDVIVVGAGIIGAAIARELGRRGARVRVFESRVVGAGATHASAGVLAPYIEGSSRGPLLDLAVRSLHLYDGFIAGLREDSGVDVEYRRCGTLEVAMDEASADRLRASAGSLQSAGASWLDAAAVRAAERALPESVMGGLLVEAHGYVAAAQLAETLMWAALRFGAELETGRKIVAISGTASGVEVTSEDGSRWSCDSVVVATGSWAAQSGLADPAVHAVRPVRGQLLRLAWQAEPLEHVVWGPDCYIVPWRDGTILVGATVEEVGFDERTTAAGVRDLLGALCELLPAAWGATFVEARAGLRPGTDDGLPIIGPSGVPGVTYATGHFRNGILLAPLTASLVADLVLEQRVDPALESVSPARFARRQAGGAPQP
ncbi:MAG TPA: glycine oxidase ThiO [Vicinamibacterales bacterium]|nr:glycine oxidase ThiO [Vicinamibacterales bacterium]